MKTVQPVQESLKEIVSHILISFSWWHKQSYREVAHILYRAAGTVCSVG